MEVIYDGVECATGNPVRVRLEHGRIAGVGALPLLAGTPGADALPSLPYLCPGFTDLQLNGYAGIDYSGPGLGAAGEEGATVAIETLVRAVAASGTVRHLATLVTNPRERIVASCAAIARAARASPLVAAAVVGIHVEGPFISPQDGPRGAHDPRHVRKPDWEEFLAWQDAAGGMIRIVTLAPELDGAPDFIARLSAHGVVAAIGHTAASPAEIRNAIAAGARLSTHLGNGSHATLPRLKNYLWEQLGADALWASIIADGFHLPDAVIRSLARAKGLERLVLVSDAAFLAGKPPGIWPWGDMQVQVHADGHLGLAGTEFLAAAGHLLDHDLARFVAATGVPVREATNLCVRNPARLLGLPAAAEGFVPGAPASLAVFRHHPGAARLEIEACVVGGTQVYARGT